MFSIAEAYGTRRFGPHRRGSFLRVLHPQEMETTGVAHARLRDVRGDFTCWSISRRPYGPTGFGASGPALRQATRVPSVCEPSSECKTVRTS